MNTRRLFLLALVPAFLDIARAADKKGKGKKDDDDGWTLNWILRDQKGEFVNSENYQVTKRLVYNSKGKLIGDVDVQRDKIVFTFDRPDAEVQGRAEAKPDGPGQWKGFFDPKNGERRRLELRRLSK